MEYIIVGIAASRWPVERIFRRSFRPPGCLAQCLSAQSRNHQREFYCYRGDHLLSGGFQPVVYLQIRIWRALSLHIIDLLLVAVIATFLGVFLVNRYLHILSMRGVQIIVSVMLFAIALGLGSGVI
jgi:hypothetical protein